MPISVAQLPSVTLVDRQGSRTLALAGCGAEIEWFRRLIATRLGDAERIGIVFRSSEQLVLAWLAVLACGKAPLILTYPNRKQQGDHWRATMIAAVADMGLGGIICGTDTAARLAGIAPLLVQEGPIGRAHQAITELAPRSFLQMSSGTTGRRKGIEFAWETLERHIETYDRVMQLGPADRVVSWLPLYHDMGLVAAFAMPLLRGVPIVMIDPMDWVEDKALLFDAIREHGATICYMPNFGFEVMSREPCSAADLASMRLWISCSEPTYRGSLERFCRHTGVPADRVAVCYAMAENVFAVTQRSGLRTERRGDREVVSCGRVLPDTELKILDGEIWVRSGSSLSAYIDGRPVVDSEGFYPTGDLGFIIDDELFIEGRRQDLLVQAGRKFFLNDFDRLLNEADPDIRGRGACLAVLDERLGTERLLVLVERDAFYDPDVHASVAAALDPVLPIADWELHLVPPRFITKTSSGKTNRRKTAADFQLVRTARASATGRFNFSGRLLDMLPRHDPTIPVRELVDSLGLVVIESLAAEAGLRFSPEMSAEDLMREANRERAPEEDDDFEEAIAIVSCMDFDDADFRLTEADCLELTRRLGVTVTYEYVCLPPVHFIWQDLVFRDYFLPRQPSEKFDSYLYALGRLDQASVLLFDDIVEIALASCAFPLMDRGFRRAPIADLLAFRAQRYASRHHELPVGDVMLGMSVSWDEREFAYRAIGQYLGVPVFRGARFPQGGAHTAGWEYVDFVQDGEAARHRRFLDALAAFLEDRLDLMPRRRRRRDAPMVAKEEMIHFCSLLINPALIEDVVSRFDRFIIQGRPNSVPYLAKRLRQRRKPVVYVPTLGPDGTLGPVDMDPANVCVIQTGAWRDCVTELPMVRLVRGEGADFKNLPDGVSFPLEREGLIDYRFQTIFDLNILAALKQARPREYPTQRYPLPKTYEPEVTFIGFYRDEAMFRFEGRFCACPIPDAEPWTIGAETLSGPGFHWAASLEELKRTIESGGTPEAAPVSPSPRGAAAIAIDGGTTIFAPADVAAAQLPGPPRVEIEPGVFPGSWRVSRLSGR